VKTAQRTLTTLPKTSPPSASLRTSCGSLNRLA
jgi:hypothetical protein